MDFRRVDVLKCTTGKDTEYFHEDDIVKIKTRGTFGRDIIGRIDEIDTLEITIDCSNKYQSWKTTVKYEEILWIKIFDLSEE